MYKLFLTFRYLTRKAIVIFPILVVWLCVSMMIIVTSIMGGFVERVRQANRNLLGDIVIYNKSMAGWPYYEELQKELETLRDSQGRKVVLASTPVVNAYGLINFVRYPNNGPAQIYGIDPAGRAAVSGFGQTLYRQYVVPRQAVEDLERFGLPNSRHALIKKAQKQADDTRSICLDAERDRILAPPEKAERLEDARDQAEGQAIRAERTLRLAESLPDQTFQTADDLRQYLLPKEATFDIPPAMTRPGTGSNASQGGCIVGADMRIYRRSRRGDYVRPLYLDGLQVVLTVVPVAVSGSLIRQPTTETLTIVDDSYSGVYDVDRTYVYAPFKIVQKMAFMEGSPEDGIPPRCNEIDLKVADANDPVRLKEARQLIDAKLNEFMGKYPALHAFGPQVQTWQEKQAQYINAVQNEKYMQIFILGLMSLVVLVVIFLIFYMIVRDKTKDIGIIKALGGSEEGVGSIFVLYGAMIGIVGGLLGVLSGVQFVTHTNQIHEWIYRVTGVMIWDRSVYMFDRIPDTVNPREVAMYFAAAVVAGILGALLPAIVAGSRNPVEAVRYE